MIPKIIHYCWLSNEPFPANIQYCINSWKKILPDYELILWNFDRFPMGKSKWVDEAFTAKKFAFAADYIRLYALYHFGGIYLDSDVEVVKSFDELLSLPYFVGMEDTSFAIEASTMGFMKGHPLLKELLERYEGRSFYKKDGSMDIETLPQIIRTGINKSFTLKPIKHISDFENDPLVVNVFPIDWFSPKKWDTKEINMTTNTFSIHHFAGSWLDSHENNSDQTDYSTQPLISILVPVYNVEKYLDRCIDSLIKQSYQKIEIIIVNDGSTDNSPHMCDRWAEIDSRIKVIHQENKGLLSARKTAVNTATGEFIIFLDSDDWLEKNTCELCLETIAKDCVDIVGFNFIIEDGAATMTNQQKDSFNNYFCKQPIKIHGAAEMLTNVFVERNILWNVAGKMYRSEIVKKTYNYLDGIKCNYAEDLFTSIFIYSFAKSTVTISNRCYHYRVGVGMSTKSHISVSDYINILEAYDSFNAIKDIAFRHEILFHCPVNILDKIENMLHETISSYLVPKYGSPDFQEWVNLWENKIGTIQIISYFVNERIKKDASYHKETSSALSNNNDEITAAWKKSHKHLKLFQKMIYVSLLQLIIIIALIAYIVT